MYFEAESNGTKYEINVREDRTSWMVGIKPEEKEWVYHTVEKANYKKFDRIINFLFKNSSYLVDVDSKGTDYNVYTRGSFRNLKIFNDEMLLHESLKTGGSISDGNSLESGMPGKIVKVYVKAGDKVNEGDPLLIMEAMKMENEMRASKDGVVKEVHVKTGQNVEGSTVLISFDE